MRKISQNTGVRIKNVENRIFVAGILSLVSGSSTQNLKLIYQSELVEDKPVFKDLMTIKKESKFRRRLIKLSVCAFVEV